MIAKQIRKSPFLRGVLSGFVICCLVMAIGINAIWMENNQSVIGHKQEIWMVLITISTCAIPLSVLLVASRFLQQNDLHIDEQTNRSAVGCGVSSGCFFTLILIPAIQLPLFFIIDLTEVQQQISNGIVAILLLFFAGIMIVRK